MKLHVALFNMIIIAVLFLASCDGRTTREGVDETDTVADETSGILSGEWDDDDRNDFVKSAVSINNKEIRAGEIAQNRAKDQGVKDYAQTLINDHRDANQKLKNIIQNKNINVQDTLKDDHKEKIQELQDASNDEFRKKFLDMMVEGHEDAIDKFEEAQEKLKDQELRSWVQNTLPTLRNHLDRAKQLQNQQ